MEAIYWDYTERELHAMARSGNCSAAETLIERRRRIPPVPTRGRPVAAVWADWLAGVTDSDELQSARPGGSLP